MNRSLLFGLSLMTLAACAGNALGAVTANGSRICDANRATIPGIGIDANYTLTDNGDVIIYAAGVNDGGCRFKSGEGGHTLQFRELPAGAFADVPTSSGTGPFLASTGTSLVDDDTVLAANRRANLGGDGSFVPSGQEFEGSQTLEYASEVDGNRTEAQWALDFSNAPAYTSYEFQVRWGSKNCGDEYVTYLAQITTGPVLTIADHTKGQELDAFTESGGETKAELFAFQLDPDVDTINVSEVIFSLSDIVGLIESDWQFVDLVVDADNSGDLDPGETTTVGGTGTPDHSAGTLTFGDPFDVSAVTSYIVRADFPSLSEGDTVTISKGPITASSHFTGSTSAAVHAELTVSTGFTWLTAADDVSLSTTGSWQDVDLSGSVPVGTTGAVIELSNTTGVLHKGVLRAKGDTRDYMSNTGFNRISGNAHRYQIVKLDASRFAQGWIDNVAVKFRLVGYTYGSDPSYFTSPPQITLTAGGWTTVDVSAQVDADADGVILFIQNEDAVNRTYGMRELTSSDITLSMRNHRSRMHVVGLDAAKNFDAYTQTTTGVKVYLVGQTKASVVYYTNNVAVTDTSLNSWQPLDADSYTVPAVANGLVLSVWNSGAVRDIGLRHGDSNDDFAGRKLNGSQGFQAVTGINGANEWDQYQGTTNIDVYIAAYTKPPSSASPPKIVSWREVNPN